MIYTGSCVDVIHVSYIIGLFPSMDVAFLWKVLRYCNNLFSRFGAVSKVEIKTKKDIDGNVAQTFAFIDLKCGEDGVSQCISTIANKK